MFCVYVVEMRTLQIYCAVWIVTGLASAQIVTRFNFTYSMASLCKEHLCQHGYNYEVFYQVNAEDRKMVRSDPSIVYEMHIAILAASNGHILLSAVPNPDASDRVYEIVVGGGGNRYTELRANLKKNAKASAKTLQILSPTEFRAFCIKITEDGLIEFGLEGDVLPILSYQDMDPITVKYFSFAAWSGVEAKFLYDCPIPSANKTEGSITRDSKPIEPKLSNSEKLMRTLLLGKDPGMPPAPDVAVDIGVRLTNVMYDAYTSKLTAGLSIIRRWTDDSLAWNPNKFNGIDQLTFRQGQIWSPQLTVYNSQKMLDDRNLELIYMNNSGTAILHMRTTIDTWCADHTEIVSKWPRDSYYCMIDIELWEVYEKVTLNHFNSSNIYELEIISGIDEDIQNAWEVTSRQDILNVAAWKKHFGFDYNKYTHQSDRFVIIMYFQRRATVYNIVFYTPLLVLVTFVLLSFWSERLSMKRIWFYAGCSVVICMGLCNIDVLVPCHTIPTVLILYVVVLIGVLLAMLIQITLKTNSVAKNLCKTSLVQSILTSHYFRSIYCLAPLKVCHTYESVSEGCDSEPLRNGNVEEIEREKDDYNECNDLAEAIDKSMFVIYSLTIVIMLAMHF